MYKHLNNKNMTSGAIAAMLSTILYGRRFFPYYVYNIIGGLDEEGELVRENRDAFTCSKKYKYDLNSLAQICTNSVLYT